MQVLIWLEPEKSCSLRHKLGRAPKSSSNCRASARLGRFACTCEVMVDTGGCFGSEELGLVGMAMGLLRVELTVVALRSVLVLLPGLLKRLDTLFWRTVAGCDISAYVVEDSAGVWS